MKVILQKDIPNLGEAGDLIVVKNGYARNFLLPRNLVLEASAANEKQRRHQERLIKLKKEKREKIAKTMAEKFSQLTCEFKMRVGDQGKLFGSVTALDIAQNLYDQGYSIDKRKIHLHEPIKVLGEFSVSVKLAEGVDTKVKVKVMNLEGIIVQPDAAEEEGSTIADSTAADQDSAHPVVS